MVRVVSASRGLAVHGQVRNAIALGCREGKYQFCADLLSAENVVILQEIHIFPY